jgi:hypothetical protein
MQQNIKREFYQVPMYYCYKCCNSHHPLSPVGRSHVKHARPEQQKRLFKEFGLY